MEPAANADGRYMRDQVTPGFGRLRSKGLVVMNPMLSVSSVREGSTVAYEGKVFRTTTTSGGVTTVVDDWSSGYGSPSSFGLVQPLLCDIVDTSEFVPELNRYGYASVAAIGDACLTNALAKASSGEGVLALVTAAELPKTLDMVWSITQSLRHLVDTLKRFDRDDGVLQEFAKLSYKEIKLLAKYGRNKLTAKSFKGMRLGPLGMRRLGMLCGLWLGYRYGIMATYYDITSWSRDLKTGKYRVRFTSNSSSSYNHTDNGLVTSNPHFDVSTASSRMRTTRSSAGCLVAPDVGGSWGDHGVTRVLSTAWELIPLSFVLDWCYDVSQRIAAFETSFLCSVKGTWISHKSDLVWQRTYDDTPKSALLGTYPDWTVINGIGGWHVTSTLRSKVCERIANPTASVVPTLRVNLNWKRVADGIALTVVLRETFKNLMKRL